MLLWLGTIVVLLAAGWGVDTVIHRQAEPVRDAVSEVDLDFLETAGQQGEDRQSRRLPTATVTDVVTAEHRATGGEQSTVVQAGFEFPRPASNPPVWLDGRIEDAFSEPAPRSSRAANAAASRGFNPQFTTK